MTLTLSLDINALLEQRPSDGYQRPSDDGSQGGGRYTNNATNRMESPFYPPPPTQPYEFWSRGNPDRLERGPTTSGSDFLPKGHSTTENGIRSNEHLPASHNGEDSSGGDHNNLPRGEGEMRVGVGYNMEIHSHAYGYNMGHHGSDSTEHMYKDIPSLKREKDITSHRNSHHVRSHDAQIGHSLSNGLHETTAETSHNNISNTLLALKYGNHHAYNAQPSMFNMSSAIPSDEDVGHQSSQLQQNGSSSYSPNYTALSSPQSFNNPHDSHQLLASHSTPHGNSHTSIFPSMSVNVSMSMNVGPSIQRSFEPASYESDHSPPHWPSRLGHHQNGASSYYPPDLFHPSHGNYPSAYTPHPGAPYSPHPTAPYTPHHPGYMCDTDNKIDRDYYSYKSATAHDSMPRLYTPTDSVSRLYSLGAISQRRTRVASYDVTNVKVNLCRICGKTYARPSTLKTHMRTHSGEKPYKCGTCKKSFSQAANLTAHVRTHSGEKPFRCPVCDRRFSQSSSVTTHMRTHSGERPYRCKLCKKAFSDSSTLTKHLRIHSGEKPYQCKLCLLRFSQSGNLNRHMRVHNTQQ